MTHVGNEGQYHYSVAKNDEVIDARAIDDPFVVTTIVDQASRWDCLRAVFTGGFDTTFRVRVWGSPEAHRVVFRGDYTPAPEGEWRFAPVDAGYPATSSSDVPVTDEMVAERSRTADAGNPAPSAPVTSLEGDA